MQNREEVPGSFRDPSGVLFYDGPTLYREIRASYGKNYTALMRSGLYQELLTKKLLIPHEEITKDSGTGSVIIRPQKIAFVSYPHEWCFSQLKDAALLTLKIQEIALNFGMSLKDASAYNVQFHEGRPILIDTLSFEEYHEGKPWVAYKQFCEHFLAPLALMVYVDVRLSILFRDFIDGVPLDLASKLLPTKSKFSFSLLMHIHLHAKAQRAYAGKGLSSRHKEKRISLHAFRALIDSLHSVTERLRWSPKGTEWEGYYQDTNYSDPAMQHKESLVRDYLSKIKPHTVWDLGANTGRFSEIAASLGANVVAFDVDAGAVEKSYLGLRKANNTKIFPLLLDLTNPSPSIGWAHKERMSLVERGPADAILSLALVHHLAISNNVPFRKIAEFFASITSGLIIEFVPKSDSQVQKLLRTREDIFLDYNQEKFEAAFSSFFEILDFESIRDSERVLYLMVRKV